MNVILQLHLISQVTTVYYYYYYISIHTALFVINWNTFKSTLQF